MIELPGIALTDTDLEGLRQSWINRENAERTLLRRVTSLEGAELIGQNDGKESGAHGERLDVKGVIPDFDRIAWTERRVIIVFDSDVRTNDNVRAARLELARHLIYERGARVHFMDVPETAVGGKTGMDDL